MTKDKNNTCNLFALLIAIDKYLDPITPLNGCVNDILKIKEFLATQDYFLEQQVKVLTNSEATKENIINGFREHLALATQKDTVLVYFSGHGTQEEAHDVFLTSESDKKIQSLVCFDGVMKVNGETKINLVADKELRFLINELAVKSQPHIITIFDCCHSGGNTRNGVFLADKFSGVQTELKERRLSMAFPKRKWSDFIFGHSISEMELSEKGIAKALPEGKHIQISACQNDESAYEINGGGVFTKNLIEILYRCNGNISYHRLQSTVQSYLKHQFNQTPKIYVSKGHTELIFNNFLNKDNEQSSITGQVSYNKTLGWIMDMGSLQGISKDTSLKLFTEKDTTAFSARVTSVSVTYSKIEFPESLLPKPDENSIFRAEVKSFLRHPLQLYLDENTKIISKNNGLLKMLEEENTIILVDNISEGDLCLANSNDHLIISRPSNSQIALAPPFSIEEMGKNGKSKILNYLKHISNYNFIKNLVNPASFILQPNAIKMSFYSNEDPKSLVPIDKEEVQLNFKETQQGWGGSIRIGLKNVSNKKLYCALCYLSFNFGVHTQLLPTGVVGLDPNATTWVFDGDPIRFKLEPEIMAYNYPGSISFLKLFISTEDFTQQLHTMNLDDLPSPISDKSMSTKGLQLEKKSAIVEDWTTRLITVKMPNPEYKPES